MDVDYLRQSINEIDLDDIEEDEEIDKIDESEEDDDEEIDVISSRTPSKAVQEFIRNVLTDEQRAALRNGECFFCHKQGHFYRDCKARKTYVNSKGKSNMAGKYKPKPSGNKSTPRKKGNYKPKARKVDPNAMVYNIEDDDEDPFEEYSNNGNF